MKRASTFELYLPSGRICRFGAGPLRGIYLLLLLALGAIFGAALFAVGGTGGVECAANDVIANARQIFHTAAAHEHDQVLLQVVADAGNVRRDLFTVGQANARDF